MKEQEKQLIREIADDVWDLSNHTQDYSLQKKIKQISGVLHDLGANHDTTWYQKNRI